MKAHRNMRLTMSAGVLCLFLLATIMSLREVRGQGECISCRWYHTYQNMSTVPYCLLLVYEVN